MKKYFFPLVLLAVFEAVAVVLWLTRDNLFYLFNFSYIGVSVLRWGCLAFREKIPACARGSCSFWWGCIC